jgi:hypothetical protein
MTDSATKLTVEPGGSSDYHPDIPMDHELLNEGTSIDSTEIRRLIQIGLRH